MKDYNGWEDNWKKEQYVPVFVDELTEAEATYALREAWKRIYGDYPGDKSLALLWSQSALETGRWKVIRNNNFGNIKKKHYKKLSWKEIPDDGHSWTMFATGENLWNKELQKTEWHWFEPPHYQTHFRSYKNVVDGAEDYIRLVSQRSRYKLAWAEVLKGDPRAFSRELRKAGYYTASEAKYTAGVVRLFEEFLRRKDELLSWKPEKKVPVDKSRIEIQKAIEDTMIKAKKDGFIIPSAEESVIENEKPDINIETESISIAKEKKIGAGKASFIMFIAAGITAAYAWITGLFQ